MAYKLGPATISRDDVELLCLEASNLADFVREQGLVKAATAKASLPEVSPGMSFILTLKPGAVLPSVAELDKLRSWLEQIKSSAPEINLTLPGLPTAQFKNDILMWFRAEVHPEALLVVEYNRAIAGGFVLRAGNQLYDYSFRKVLLGNSKAMVKVMQRFTTETGANV